MRVRVFIQILLIGLTFLIVGLFYTQVVRYDEYRIMSEGNRLRVTPLTAPRGSIFDRHGNILAKDALSFNASVIYSQIRDKNALAKLLSEILEIDKNKIDKGIDKCRRRPYSPVYVVSDIGTKAAIQLEEAAYEYPGLFVEATTKREYVDGESMASVLGYIGRINRPEFDRLKHYGYQINDMIGRAGLEKQYDNYLRGKHGGKQVEVDNRGREVATIGYREPIPGRNIHTTLDLDLQKFCNKLLKDKRGAIVAMDPQTGKILAMASAPSYDPEIFVDRKRSGEIKALLANKLYPLMNRAISGAYPPGSIFKLVVAVAALESGKATPETESICEGYITLGKRAFRCWKKTGHGKQTMTDAIKNSCNVYFYRLGLLVGADNIAAFARKFGFGKFTKIDLPGEVEGSVPSPQWKEKTLKQQWYKGETVNFAIGQGYLLVTPIQISGMMSVFANSGYLVRPYVVEFIGDVRVNSFEKQPAGIRDIAIDTVREGTRKCVNGHHGTGMKARLPDVIVSGKTGTAQTSTGRDHGWFVGFAPIDNPELVVVVFDEFGGKGGYYAAETAGKVFREARKLKII